MNSVWIMERTPYLINQAIGFDSGALYVKALNTVGLDIGACDIKVQSEKGRDRGGNPEFIILELKFKDPRWGR